MKRVLIVMFMMVLCSSYARSQSNNNFSTSYKNECWWNSNTEKYDKCSGSDESSLFSINSGKTMIHHTTKTISSDYYVSKNEYDSKNDVYTYDVKSDVGNKYFFIFDEKNNQVRVVGNNKTSEGKTYMHVYTVKKMWKE
jgi:hypothetical protein